MTYKTEGVCASTISYEIEGDIIQSVSFEGGCPGNLLGISKIVVGMKVEDVINTFKGVHCGTKKTSCPDQLAKALSSTISHC